jgi:glycosyltransferase involved in cell wall biosynthesis
MFSVQFFFNQLRKLGIMFAEGALYLQVDSSKYDIVHVATFSCHIEFLGEHLPVVFSKAIEQRALYSDARKWTDGKIRFAELLERIYLGLLRATHMDYRPAGATVMVAYTERYMNLLRTACHWYPFIGTTEPSVKNGMGGVYKLAFIAADFNAKGGDVVIEVVKLLIGRGLPIELHVIGSTYSTEVPFVVSHGFVDRSRLIRELMPMIDLLVYPTKFDGWPLTIVEALAASIPVIASDYPGMRQMIDKGGTVVSGTDPLVWADTIQEILTPLTMERYKSDARATYTSLYSGPSNVVNLIEIYEQAISAKSFQSDIRN